VSETGDTYYVNLCYEAYFGKAMEVGADSLSEACKIAMECADDDGCWKDTLISSTHWIECVNYNADLVPEEFSAAAIRCGGAVLIANRLRDVLRSLVQACDQNQGLSKAVAIDVERARIVLATLPDRIVVD
jgi:hypothetical protein